MHPTQQQLATARLEHSTALHAMTTAGAAVEESFLNDALRARHSCDRDRLAMTIALVTVREIELAQAELAAKLHAAKLEADRLSEEYRASLKDYAERQSR